MDNKLPRGISERNNILYLSFSVGGERYRESIGLQVTKPNIKHAEKKLQAIRYEISIGTFNYLNHFPNSKKATQLKQKSGSNMLIADLLNDWLKRMNGNTAYSTRKDYSSAINFHLIPRFGGLTVAELTGKDIEEWLSTLAISGKRKRNILTPLRGALGDAVYDELIDKNPMDRVRTPKHSVREPKPFNKREVSLILGALEGVERNLYQFAFETGLRTSELIALMWEDVDMEKSVIHVRRACVRGRLKETKTSSGWRSVPLSQAAQKAIKSQFSLKTNTDGYVFFDPKNNARWPNDQIIRKRVWMKAMDASGVEYRNPYQTRHTYASQLLSNGANPLKVAQYMGHSDWGMIRKVYGRWIC